MQTLATMPSAYQTAEVALTMRRIDLTEPHPPHRHHASRRVSVVSVCLLFDDVDARRHASEIAARTLTHSKQCAGGGGRMMLGEIRDKIGKFDG